MAWISIPIGAAALWIGIAIGSFGGISDEEFMQYAQGRSDQLERCIVGLTSAVVRLEELKRGQQ